MEVGEREIITLYLLYHFIELESSAKSRGKKSGMARPLEAMASAGVSGLSPTTL